MRFHGLPDWQTGETSYKVTKSTRKLRSMDLRVSSLRFCPRDDQELSQLYLALDTTYTSHWLMYDASLERLK